MVNEVNMCTVTKAQEPQWASSAFTMVSHWRWDEIKAHITSRHWNCAGIKVSGRGKASDFTEGSPFLRAMPLVIIPFSTSNFPPSGSQQGYTLNHFVLYLEKLSDRLFCGPHKSISSCYRARNSLFFVLLTLEVLYTDGFSRETLG